MVREKIGSIFRNRYGDGSRVTTKIITIGKLQ